MKRLIVSILERIPFTPWWLARRREEQERRAWLRHLRHYYSRLE